MGMLKDSVDQAADMTDMMIDIAAEGLRGLYTKLKRRTSSSKLSATGVPTVRAKVYED